MPALAAEDQRGEGGLMNLFRDRKPPAGQSRDALSTLRATLANLEAEPEQSPRIEELKRILAGRIAEMEGRSA